METIINVLQIALFMIKMTVKFFFCKPVCYIITIPLIIVIIIKIVMKRKQNKTKQ